MELVKLHDRKEFTDECAELLNSEWPRSKAARLYSLEKSCDQLPCSLILLSDGKVVGHSKLLPVHGLQNACLLESVIVSKSLRGKGLGRQLMTKTEDLARSMGFKTMHLNTIDKQEFYQHIGFQFSKPVLSLGANAHLVTDSMLTKLMGTMEDELSIDKKEPEDEKAKKEFPPVPDTIPPPPPSIAPPPPPPPPPPSSSAESTDNRHVIRLSRNKISWMKKDL